MSKLVFFSTCPEVWGGSEELWASTARRLAEAGHEVEAYKTVVVDNHPKFQLLTRAGCHLVDLRKVNYPLWLRMLQRLLPQRWQPSWGGTPLDHLLRRRWSPPPGLVVVSQGENFDGVHLADLCRLAHIPYVILCQKASDIIWPDDNRRELGRRAYQGARHCYFVSEHNLQLTQAQLGLSLPRATVVRNPVLAGAAGPLPWPEAGVWKLACVARLWLQDKGQDMLFRALAQPQWRERNLEISLIGSGVHRGALEGLAARLELSNIRFAGTVSNIEEVWKDHHGLILSSRAEGLPLAAIEAMMCGRPCFLTPVGGNAELVSSPEVGLIAKEASTAGLADLLERAWQVREQWRDMGQAAATHVRQFVRQDPVQVFCDLLCQELKPYGLSVRADPHL